MGYMEMNTSERRINKDVVEILKPSLLDDPFKGTIKEGCKCKYSIINLDDLEKYIDIGGKQDLAVILDHVQGNIEHGREQDGKKPFNHYIVINIDEPYINDIVAVLESNGHWDGQPAAEDNTLNRYKRALHKIIEEDMPNCDGWESEVIKIAREALGLSKEEVWEKKGECGWCGNETNELSGPHLMDFVPGEKMCRNCWEHDRETYLGSVGTDIGEFKAIGSDANGNE